MAAHIWLNLAAAQGNKAARQRPDLLAEAMTPEQNAEAQRRTETSLAARGRARLQLPGRRRAGQQREVRRERAARARRGVTAYNTAVGGFIDAVQPNLRVEENVDSGRRTGARVALRVQPNERFAFTPRLAYQDVAMDGWNRIDAYNILANPFTTTRPAVTLSERQQFTQIHEPYTDTFLLADFTLELDIGGRRADLDHLAHQSRRGGGARRIGARRQRRHRRKRDDAGAARRGRRRQGRLGPRLVLQHVRAPVGRAPTRRTTSRSTGPPSPTSATRDGKPGLGLVGIALAGRPIKH